MSIVSRFNDHVKRLLGRAEVKDAPPPLSNSVVQHDMIDEGVLGEFRDRSDRFNSLFNNVPDVTVKDAEYDDAGNMKQQAEVRPYEPAPDLYSDLFYAHHTFSEPEIRPAEEVLPSHELHRQVMQQYVHADGFNDLRAMTRHDDITSALTTLTAKETIDEHLRTTLAEHAKRAEEMQQAQEAMMDLAGANQSLRDQIAQQGGVPTQEQKDNLRQNAQSKYDARKRLEQLAQEQQQAPLGLDAQAAVNEAIDNARQDAEMMSSMPGSQTGMAGNMSPEEALQFAEEIKNNPQVHQVLAMLGRMERDMRYKRTNRVIGGREEPIDVMLGDDLGLTLPSELMRLRHPLLRLDFMRRYYEKSLVQYETVGYAEAGKGPIVVCIDISGSMGGGKIVWARAVALSLLSIAHREKRHCYFIDFNGAVVGEWNFPARTPIDTGQIISYAGKGASGGTNITAAALRAEQVIGEDTNFKTADIVVITDGDSSFGSDAADLKGRLMQRGVRRHGVLIGGGNSGYLASMCDEGDVTSVEDLAAENDATTALASNIT